MKKYELRDIEKGFSQKDFEKTGLLKRFLDWIVRGTKKSNIGGKSCLT